MTVALGINNFALGSYCLVVPQAIHCSELHMPKCPMTPNAQLLMTNCQPFKLEQYSLCVRRIKLVCFHYDRRLAMSWAHLFSHFGPRDVIPEWSWIVILLNKIIP